MHWTDSLMADDFVCLDTETTSLDPYTGRIRLVSLANTRGAGVLDLNRDSFDLVRKFKDKLIVCHNMAFDLKFLWNLHFRPTQLWCTMICEKMLGNGKYYGFGLDDVAGRRLGLVLDKELQRSDWSNPNLTREQYLYSLRDAEVLVPIFQQQRAEMLEKESKDEKQKTLPRLFSLEMKVLPVICHMEMCGIGMDLNIIRELQIDVEEESKKELSAAQSLLPAVKLPKSFFNATGTLNKRGRELYPHGVRKPETRDDFIKAYTELGIKLPTKKDKETGVHKVSLSAETYGHVDHPSAAHLENHVKLKKTLTSYIYPVLGTKGTSWVHPTTHRVHSSVDQVGTGTGRFTFKDPALQTIPKRGDIGDKMRRSVFASKGHAILKADYSQIEMRVMAEVTKDANLIQVYKNKEDIYKKTASYIFNCSMDKLTKAQRNEVGKPVTLGSQYGQTPSGLVIYLYKNTGKQYTYEECKTFSSGFFKAYPGIGSYHRAIEASAETRWYEDYYAYSLDGRVKIWPAKTIPKKTFDSGYTKYYCNDIINYKVQSSVGGRMKEAMRILDEENLLQNVHLILQVHDELVFEVPIDFVAEYAKILSEVMIRAMKTVIEVVPIKVECSWGPNWGTTTDTYSLEF